MQKKQGIIFGLAITLTLLLPLSSHADHTDSIVLFDQGHGQQFLVEKTDLWISQNSQHFSLMKVQQSQLLAKKFLRKFYLVLILLLFPDHLSLYQDLKF